MKEVLIQIKGTQQCPDQEPDVTTFTTTGSYLFENNKVEILYSENETIGAKNVQSKIILSNNTVTLERSGGMESQLIIEKGRRHSCLYNTPQGDFVIGIFGESLMSSFTERGGKLYMSYTIDVFSGLVSKNIMEIQIKEIENV